MKGNQSQGKALLIFTGGEGEGGGGLCCALGQIDQKAVNLGLQLT